jgi:hypothetical protein
MQPKTLWTDGRFGQTGFGVLYPSLVGDFAVVKKFAPTLQFTNSCSRVYFHTKSCLLEEWYKN